jgi:AcrR family transcriptional regulator
MTGKRRTQEERASETKNRLIIAAYRVLKAKGYAGFRVNDVTEIAGLSRGAQTHHFPTKMDLIFATFEWLYDRIAERSKRRVSQVKDGDDILQCMLEDACDFFLGEDFSIGLDLIVSAERDMDLKNGIMNIVKDRRFLVEELWMEQLTKKHISHSDAEDLLWLIFNSMRGLATRSLWQKDEVKFEHIKKLTLVIARERYERMI